MSGAIASSSTTSIRQEGGLIISQLVQQFQELPLWLCTYGASSDHAPARYGICEFTISSNVGTAISEKYSPRRTTYSTSPQETAGRATCPRPRSTVAPLQEAADRATCLRPSTTG
eukprot:gene6800-30771_t